METTLLPCSQWAQSEFSGAELGDRRRTKRLVCLAGALAQTPSGALPGALPGWSELKAAYRLLSSPQVTHASVSASHWQRSREACRAPGEYLLIEDTTTLDYTQHEAATGLGRIGNDSGRGLLLHSTLATRIERWDDDDHPHVALVGLAGQKIWARTQPAKKKHETKEQRLTRPRESQRWGEAIEAMDRSPPSASWTYVADRESDVYELFQRCRAHDVGFLVRAAWPRALTDRDESLFEFAAQAPSKGRFAISLRARTGESAREVTLEVRAGTCRLRGPQRPGGRPEPITVNVVEVSEVEASSDVAKPIRWVLLTSWPVETFSQARRAVRAYAQRWLIEEYHKALKTGAKVEESQLASADRLEALVGVLAIVAVRLLATKLIARTHGERPLDFDVVGAEAQAILEAKFGRPSEGWTYETFLVAVARLGGFLARKSDGSPGWLTIWRGWNKLMLLSQGFSLALGQQ